MPRIRTSVFLLLLFRLTVTALAQPAGPITLHVDATQAPQRIVHVRMGIPTKPGKLTLLYPKWIPGEHGPTGPLNDMVDLKITAAGQPLSWRRDAEEMYALQVEVPAGASDIEVTMDQLLPASGEGSATTKLFGLSWNRVLLYPDGIAARDLRYTATLRLPAGWKYGTALPVAGQDNNEIQFATVSLETLVDSPLITGTYFRTHELTPSTRPSHLLHIVGDGAEAVEAKPELIAKFSRLCTEAEALFGAHHYQSYCFLLTLSEHVGFGGLEHHESSDNSVGERSIADEDLHKLWAGLLPHEMVHSWNGKYRRPADIATPDFRQPMKTELLWVYEGLTTYLGGVLAARSGLWTEENYRQSIALEAALLDQQGGRDWRPLADTAVAAPILSRAPRQSRARRRSLDYYAESALIWLEADVLIRQQTQGQRSLDDFCRRFHGGTSGPPQVVGYTLDDVIAALNETAPYDWKQFIQSRIYQVAPRAPLGGLESAGWKVVFKDKPSEMLKGMESNRKYIQLGFSLGFTLNDEGEVSDVIPASPADRAGLAPGMKLLAVNGRKWSSQRLRSAVKASSGQPGPIELLVENSDYFSTLKLDYHDGERYPDLQRDDSRPDLLANILKPLTSPEKKEPPPP